jgi:hypothetical protein
MFVRTIREMPPEQALELARNSAATARELAAQAEEQLAEALTRYNQAGGEITA